MGKLKKFTVRLDPTDVAVLKKAFPEQGYTQAIRAAVHTLAEQVRRWLAGEKART